MSTFAPSPAPSRPSLSLAISPRLTLAAVASLLAFMAVLLVASVRQESQTFDESAHLYAGFEYWKHADFGHNPEHPPLAKLLAALPLLPMALREPPTPDVPYFKAQDFIGAQAFLYRGNAPAGSILFCGRLVLMLFPLVLGLLVFLAAREMFSPLTGLIALCLFVFEPVLLANGPLVTTDMPLTCLFFASVYTFYRYAQLPSPARLALCALATALAVTAKHSALLIFPTLFLLAIAAVYTTPAAQPEPARRRQILQLASALLVLAAVSYAFLWTLYGFRYAARPGGGHMVPSLDAYAATLSHIDQRSLISFLGRHHLLPEAYLFGWTDILLIPGRRPFFLFGHVFASGRWFYFPAVLLIKTSLTLLLFLLLLPFARIRQHRRERLFLVIPTAFYLLVAIWSMLNMGVRHVLVLYPFLIILGAAAAAAFGLRSRRTAYAVTALLVFNAISSLHAFPDFLAHSNELFGGPAHTWQVASDANADWGQGFLWTRAYLDRHPTPDCWFDAYSPVVDPAYFGIPCKPLPSGFGTMVGLSPTAIPRTLSGTILLSSTDLSGAWWGPDELNPYDVFRHRKPDDLIGNIILVYHGTFPVPLLAGHANASAAATLLRQHRPAEALARAQTAVQLAPTSARIYQVLAQTLAATGQMEQARQANATALHLAQTIHPDYQARLIQQLQTPAPTPPR